MNAGHVHQDDRRLYHNRAGEKEGRMGLSVDESITWPSLGMSLSRAPRSGPRVGADIRWLQVPALGRLT